jgi:hypothetical protein
MASLTSVLRPGTFFTCAAFASTNGADPIYVTSPTAGTIASFCTYL